MEKEHSVYFITADDEFIACNRAREIFERESADIADELSKEVIDGSSMRADEAVKALENARAGAATLSLFGGKKVVWLKNVNFMADNNVSRSEAVREAIEKFAEFLKNLEGASVIISASPIDRRKRFFKDMQKFARCEDFQTGKDPVAACAQSVEKKAGELGVELLGGAAETLAAVVGGNPRMAFQELEKLANYAGENGKISEREVLEMVPVFGEGDFFEISEAFYSGNLDNALAKLSRYFFTNKNASARPIIATIQKQNSLLIQLRALMDSGDLPRGILPRGAMENAFSKYEHLFSFDGREKSPYDVFSQNPWYAGSKLAPVAARMSMKKLIDIQSLLIRAFRELIGQGNSEESIMRDFFARALSK